MPKLSHSKILPELLISVAAKQGVVLTHIWDVLLWMRLFNTGFKLHTDLLRIQHLHFRRSAIPAVLILFTISAVNFGRPMDIHQDNIGFWVNSVYTWSFSVFILIDNDDIIQSDYIVSFS